MISILKTTKGHLSVMQSDEALYFNQILRVIKWAYYDAKYYKGASFCKKKYVEL